MDNFRFETFKAGALLRVYFLDRYAKLEKEVRKNFESCLQSVDPKIINKLYFYYGSNHMFKFGLDYSDDKATGTHKKFKDSEFFREFPIAKIIKISAKDRFIDKFEINIGSVNKSSIEFPFYSVVLKLVNMRNILAHEPASVVFNEKDHIVETISLEKLKEYDRFNIDGYTFEYSDEVNIQIMSNLIYLEIILDILQNE